MRTVVVVAAMLVSTAQAAQLLSDAFTGGTLACKTWTKGEGQLVRKAGFACLSATTGALLGALTNARGRVVCTIQGYDDGQCLHVIGCRMDQVTCR